MVERLHRTLKAALMAKCNNNNWTTNLPWILLGLRTTPKEGSNTTAAEMTYGDNLQVPGDFFATPGNTKIQDIRHQVKKYVPCRPSYKNTRKTYLPPNLHKASHVFLRINAQKAPQLLFTLAHIKYNSVDKKSTRSSSEANQNGSQSAD